MKHTSPILTKYERSRILGARALQISMGAPILIDPCGKTSPLDIAILELNAKVIPIIITRPLPNGKVEKWKLSELII